MKLLLDTHVAIWLAIAPERIPLAVRHLIATSAGEAEVSAASVWEIAIKHRLGRGGQPPFSGRQAIMEFEAAGLVTIDVNVFHAAFVQNLPLIHADPFDRLLIAQAIVDELQLVTVDTQMARYDVPIVSWR